MGKGTRLPNACRCDRLHIWTDCTVFGKTGEWDCYYTVVFDNEEDKGLHHRAMCVCPGDMREYVAIGNRTVNEGEYSGVIAALRWAYETKTLVHIITDSQLIFGHLFDGYKCTASLLPYRDKARRLIAETGARVEWLPRAYNKAGWYNDERLRERAKDKREREKARRPVKHRHQHATPEQRAERRALALAEMEDD